MDWGDSGGGFMNDSIADEPQQLSTNVSVGTEERSKAIASVSVSQISKLTRPGEGGLVIHNKKVYHVNLIAFIHEILDISPQKIHLLVDDFTSSGPLEVSHIIGDTGVPDSDNDYSMFQDSADGFGPDKNSLHRLKVGDYIRCVGAVKYNQDKPNVMAYYLSYVDDPNEISKHVLEVIRDSMQLERSIVATNQPLNKTNSNNHVNQVPQQSKPNEFGRLSNREKIVLKFVREKSDVEKDVGVPIKDICDSLKAFKKDDIVASLGILNSEGLCWQGDNESIWFANASD